MKGTNTGDQAQHGDRSRAPLQPHGFTVNRGRPQETSDLSNVLSSFLWCAGDAVPVKTAQTEKAP